MAREIWGPTPQEMGITPEEMGIEQEAADRWEVTGQTESGLWSTRIERDADGRITHDEVRLFLDPKNPSESELRSHFERWFEYDERGNLVGEVGDHRLRENGWKKAFEVDDAGRMVGEQGEVTRGANRGHAWRKTFEYDDAGRVLKEMGEILAQGENPDKQPAGHRWEFENLYDEETGELIEVRKTLVEPNGQMR